MRDVIIVGLVGAGTLAMRALYLVGLGGVTLSERSERWLGHAKPAILAALVGGFLAGGEAGVTLASGAGVVAAWVVARTGRGILTVLAIGTAVTLLLSS
jgi:branched-subunit amino acid transport protein